MPYVTVAFDPSKLSQSVIDQLKSKLQGMVADALSSPNTLGIPLTPEVSTELAMGAIETLPEEIMVTQYAAHPTDVNVPPLEIYIQAGRPKNRCGDKVVSLLGHMIANTGIIPVEHIGEGLSGIFVTFHPDNGFGFIPQRNLGDL